MRGVILSGLILFGVLSADAMSNDARIGRVMAREVSDLQSDTSVAVIRLARALKQLR